MGQTSRSHHGNVTCIHCLDVMHLYITMIDFYKRHSLKKLNWKCGYSINKSYSKPVIRNLIQFSCSVVSDSLQPHELQHTRLPCPSLSESSSGASDDNRLKCFPNGFLIKLTIPDTHWWVGRSVSARLTAYMWEMGKVSYRTPASLQVVDHGTRLTCFLPPTNAGLHQFPTSKQEGGLPRWSSGKEFACQRRRCKRHRFSPWVVKIPWRRERLPTPVLWPGEFHGGHKESHMTERLSLHFCLQVGST